MRYDIGAFEVNVDGFDIIKELEESENPDMNHLAKILRKKTQACEQQAREYFFHKKERTKWYAVEASARPFWDSEERSRYYLKYSDEDVQRLKQLILEVANEDAADDEKFTSYQEFQDEIGLDEIMGLNSELDNLLLDKLDGPIYKIDLENAHSLYGMTCRGYDERKKEMREPVLVGVELEDDEYIYLLTQQLLDRHGFTFNRLLLYNPALAQKISDKVDGCYMDYHFNNNMPYLIQFDEVKADIFAIKGPEPESEELYYHEDGPVITHVVANTSGYDMSVFQESVDNSQPVISANDPTPEHPYRDLDKISAEKVREALGVSDYKAMMQALKERYGTSANCYDEFKGFLDQHGISYEEKVNDGISK